MTRHDIDIVPVCDVGTRDEVQSTSVSSNIIVIVFAPKQRLTRATVNQKKYALINIFCNNEL